MPSRRKFLKLSLSGTALALGGWGAFSSKIDTVALELTRLDLEIADLAPEFKGYRIAFISDIHLGPFVSNELVIAAVELINSNCADMFLLGGDFINLPLAFDRRFFWFVRNRDFSNPKDPKLIHRIYDRLGEILGQAKCPDGIYGVYGNHDRWFAPRTCASSLKRHNIRLLVNEAARIERGGCKLKIIGVDDYWSGFPSLSWESPRKALNETRILLAHNPDYISKVLEKTGFEFDLGLAGHTHGGQIRIPPLGSLLHNIADPRLNSGLFQHKRAKIYTTRGIGVVELPLRINCPPEVCLFVLHPQNGNE